MAVHDTLLATHYRQMFQIRRFEEEAARAYAQGKIGGFLHLYIGQEAVAVGALSAGTSDDYVVTTYRDHGVALARGMPARVAMAELFGKHDGCSLGLGGSMHFFDAERNFLGGHGIVGGHVALAAGAAFKSKYAADGRVTICFFGEGATNIGGFHEGVSLSALWKLPIVFVCENNEYAMGTPTSRTLPVQDVTTKAEGYGIARARFPGHDVRVVRKEFTEAIERARRGEGPTLIEVKTYRFRGHSMSDPGKYRSPEEVEARKKFDPVVLGRAALLESGASEGELVAIEQDIEREIAEAVAFADAAEPARVDSIEAFTYASSLIARGGSDA